MERKIVFFDVDGTLYDREVGIPESTVKGIKELTAKGHIPVICTGRTMAFVPRDLVNIGFHGIIAGAGTYVEYKEEIVHHRVEEETFIRELLPLLKQNHISFVLEGPEYVYYDNTDENRDFEAIKTLSETFGGDKIKSINSETLILNKISCSLFPDSNLAAVLPKITEKFHIIRHQGTNFMELAPIGYNKATGIEKLITHLGIDKKHTYAFGDSSNDLEMLEYVEYGIAMGNSYPEVLERAKYKTKSLKDDGIYYGLKQFDLI